MKSKTLRFGSSSAHAMDMMASARAVTGVWSCKRPVGGANIVPLELPSVRVIDERDEDPSLHEIAQRGSS